MSLMKKTRKPVQYVELYGRMVPEDTTSPGRRAVEIVVVVVVAAAVAYFVAPLLARALA